MVDDILDRLKGGSIKKAVLFADGAKVPPPPCVVVKPEAGILNGTRSYRIIVRHAVGSFNALEEYVLTELDGLLAGGFDGLDGNRYKLFPNGFTDVTPDSDANCIFMERIYCAPAPGLAR